MTPNEQQIAIAEHSAEANRAWLAQFDAYKKRIAAMAALLDKVPHNHYVPMSPGIIVCSHCLRCAWERMKKEKE